MRALADERAAHRIDDAKSRVISAELEGRVEKRGRKQQPRDRAAPREASAYAI